VWLAIPADAVSRDARRMGAFPLRKKAGGLEALVYWDRERGKSYLQALYD
jgi:hypothetical protein